MKLLRIAVAILLAGAFTLASLDAAPVRNPSSKKTAPGAKAASPAKAAAPVREEPPATGDTSREKSRFAGRVTVTLSPARYQLFYIYLFSRKELDAGVDQALRTSEKFYPSKINILYAGSVALDDIMGTGASASFGYSGKYPVELGVKDDTESVIHHYESRWFWPYFGIDGAWLDYRSFIRLSEEPQASYSKSSLDTGMRAKALNGNVYLKLLDIHGQNSDFQSMLDSTKRERFRLPFAALLFLMGSYDNLEISSESSLIRDPLLPAFENLSFDEYRCRIFSGALMLGVKWNFWSDFFFTSALAVVSAYRIEQEFATPDGTVKGTDSGVESIYSSMEKYANFHKNPAESYTKQLLHAAVGYRGERFFCYAEYFWDVKNLKSEKVVVQYSTYDLKLVLGAHF